VFSPKSSRREGKKHRAQNLGGFGTNQKSLFKYPRFSKNIFREKKTICEGK
jgi:hypothetical protein